MPNQNYLHGYYNRDLYQTKLLLKFTTLQNIPKYLLPAYKIMFILENSIPNCNLKTRV